MPYIPVEIFTEYSGAHDNPDLVRQYVDSAENIVNAYLGYSPALHDYDQIFDGSGTTNLQLKAKPIQSITGAEINGQSVPPDFLIAGEFIYFPGSKIFPAGKNNIKIAYTAGWGTISGDDEANDECLPKLIVMTVLRIAALLQSEGGANIGVTSKSFGDSGTRAFVNFTNFDKYLIQISPYKLLTIYRAAQ
jgi:hypothetical protein